MMAMQPSIFRRNYYLIRAHSRDQLRKDEKRERQIYSQTARVVNEMITFIKNLLNKIHSYKQQLELLIAQQGDSSSQGEDCENVLQKFKQFQKEIPLTFFAQYPLDNKVLGAFVMRIGKQINYWTKPLPYLFEVVKDIDKLFQEQKNNQSENIALIYFITVKKIVSKGNQFLKGIKCIQIKPKQQTKHYIQPQHNLPQEAAHHIKTLFNNIYKDLDLEYSNYAQINQQTNVALLSKRQLKRNRKIKKQTKLYKIAYQQYILKIQKDSLKTKNVNAFSNTKFSLDKSHSKTKTKDSVGQKYIALLPSINSQQKVSSLSKAKERQFSFEKSKKKKSIIQTNKVQLRLKL